MTHSTRIDGEALLLRGPCLACNREPGALMCDLCEKLTVAEMFPVSPLGVLQTQRGARRLPGDTSMTGRILP